MAGGRFPGNAAAGRAKGIRVVPTLDRYIGPLSDHAAFASNGHPFLFVPCGQGKYYHHPKDIADLIEAINAASPSNEQAPSIDPFETEIRMLRNALGTPRFLALEIFFEIPSPKTRQELDDLITGLIANKFDLKRLRQITSRSWFLGIFLQELQVIASPLSWPKRVRADFATQRGSALTGREDLFNQQPRAALRWPWAIAFCPLGARWDRQRVYAQLPPRIAPAKPRQRRSPGRARRAPSPSRPLRGTMILGGGFFRGLRAGTR